MNVVSFGGGVNSTAMLVGLHKNHIPVDLILFADTGGEQPHTYAYIPAMNHWLLEHGMPEITTVFYTDRSGNRLTLEDECLRSCTLPSIAYGYKKCSLKHKASTQDKFCNNHPGCRDIWASGGKIVKYIGYDAGEEHRRTHAHIFDIMDKKYQKEYPLIDWSWGREECVETIRRAGMPVPGKSSCFFCPSMKKHEIRALYHKHRDLYDRATAIERAAAPNLLTVKGLGRKWSWQDFMNADMQQVPMCGVFPEIDMPCDCYDG
jgi:hypothetical protein